MLAPDNVKSPAPCLIRPPSPANAPEALVSVSVRLPSATVPVPDRFLIAAPAVVAEMSNAPLAITLLELAMLPVPDSASVPAVMAVAPA